ncbi:MAG: MmgE/PrpD family protein [Hyphomicrobiales bacterium]
MASLTAKLTELVRTKPVSDADIAAAELFALDAIANMVAGRNSGPGRKISAWKQELLGERSNSGTMGLDPPRRAFIYGAHCHILEVDDLHRASVVHPGCVVVPVLLALGKGRPRRKVLTALLHGFDACCRIGMAVGKEHYRIWHNTATCGPFGAAMAAAHLLDLDNVQTVHALGNAGSQSSGLWEFLDTGAETKHLHAGRAAESGVIAAGLAAQGFTGPPEILEGTRGFFKAACPDAVPKRVLAEPDAPWQVHLTSIKPWPSCRHTHPAIDAAQRIRTQMLAEGLDFSGLNEVEVETYQAALDLCNRVETPTAYAAKFSLQHTVSAALSHDEVTFDSFDDAARKSLSDSRKKVFVRRAEDVQSRYPAHWGTRIKAHHKTGGMFTSEVENAKGDPELPLSRAEMISKAGRLIEFGSPGLAKPIISAVQSDLAFENLYNSIN